MTKRSAHDCRGSNSCSVSCRQLVFFIDVFYNKSVTEKKSTDQKYMTHNRDILNW